MQVAQGSSTAYLKNIYADLARSNPQYSQRAFARKLGLSAGGLSQIFALKKRLSVNRAYEIAEALKLPQDEREYFLLLVQIESATSDSLRAELYERLRTHHPERAAETQNLSIEQFRLISEWYGFAVLQLVSTYGSNWTHDRIAKHLGIQKIEAEMAIERLIRLELIELTEEGYRRTKGRVLVGAPVPNEAVRKYYSEVLKKAQASIEEQGPQEKVIGAEVFAFDPADLDEVRKATDQFLDRLLTIAKGGKKRNAMYQVMVDFFRLSEREMK